MAQPLHPARLAQQLTRVVVTSIMVRSPAYPLPKHRLSGLSSAYQHAWPRRPPQQDSLLDEVVLEDEIEDRVVL